MRPCTAADSGHEEGRALDWMTNVRVPEQKAMADAFVAWLQAPDGFGNPEAMARRLGISYLIWNNQTWRAYDPGRGWTEYNGCLAPKKQKKKLRQRLPPHPRARQLHLGRRPQAHLVLRGLRGLPGALAGPPRLTSGHAVARAPVPTVPTSCPSCRRRCRAGAAAAAGPAARHPEAASARLAVPAGCTPTSGSTCPSWVAAGSRRTGVAAVVLRVQLVRPDAVGTVRVWPAGSAMPVETLPLDAAGRVAEVTVPVGTSGSVSLQLSGAMAHLRVDLTWLGRGSPPSDLLRPRRTSGARGSVRPAA